jgi:hypothetical protein
VDSDANAQDLRRIYDDYVGSSDPRQRRVAARAFAACIPAFIPNAGETPSPEPLIHSLPSAGRAEREMAYRALFARCHAFLTERRDTIGAMQDQMQRDTGSQEPGLRAQEALLAGRLDQVGPLVSEALNSADPASVASLSGFTARLAQSRSPEAPDPLLLQRARAVDAALPWVACDLGLDCGAASLQALQLCAVEGLCEGDVPARMVARMGVDAIDPPAVQQQRERLLALIRSGRPLTTADLLAQQEGR